MCTEPVPDERVQSSHLYELFCAWAKAAGEVEWKQKGFSRALKGKGFSNKQSNGMQWLGLRMVRQVRDFVDDHGNVVTIASRSEEHTSELQSLMRISYAVFCLKKKKKTKK